jgi:flagellar hook-associated protein 1 FlgK
MGTGILGIAASGLNAAQAGIRTTQQNIANVNTAGYRRQEITQSSLLPQFTGYGYVGNGVAVDQVRHQYSQFLDGEVLLNQSQYSRYAAASTRSALVDKLLGGENTGLNTSLNRFFAAAQEVANDPANSATRQNLLSAGQNLAGRFNTLAGQLLEQRAATNNDVQALTTRINVLAGQIAQANATIAQSRAANGQPANDLVDARDQLVEELSKLVDVTRLDQADGTADIFIGGGKTLVLGLSVYKLDMVQSASDPAVLRSGHQPAIPALYQRHRRSHLPAGGRRRLQPGGPGVGWGTGRRAGVSRRRAAARPARPQPHRPGHGQRGQQRPPRRSGLQPRRGRRFLQ